MPVAARWEDGLVERIDRGPLDRRATEALAESLLGASLDGVSAAELHEVSGGIPRFVRELLAGAQAEGRLVRHGPVHRLVDRPRSSLGSPSGRC